MPKKIERDLRRQVNRGKKRKWSQSRKNNYIYGTLTNIKKRMRRKRVQNSRGRARRR